LPLTSARSRLLKLDISFFCPGRSAARSDALQNRDPAF
jgi:hypothetical protein